MNPNTLEVRRGEPISPAWKRLVEFIAGAKIIKGLGVRIVVTPSGTHVSADTSYKPWRHPFKVSVSGREASVAMGSVNNLVPIIDGVGLDGLSTGGQLSPVPTLSLSGTKSGRTWVALKVAVGESGAIIPTDTGAVSLVEMTSLAPPFYEGGSPDFKGVGLHPIAVVYWSGGEVDKVHQITHHNLAHRLVKAKDGRPSRHFFWAA